MYSFIFISISLHLISFLCIVLLFIRGSKGAELKNEIEISLGQYIDKLEKENDQLVEQINTFVENRSVQLESRLQFLEKATQTKEETEDSIVIQHPSAKNERNQKAIQLYQQGFAANDIARLLNCGTGEVELIVNMHGRSGQR